MSRPEEPDATRHFDDVEACVDAVLARLGKRIVLALPLGLGKPAHFVNALYRRAARDSSLSLEILTALTLEKPTGRQLLEQRFAETVNDSLYQDHVPLLYAEALREGTLPENINVSEFYFRPGAYMGSAYAQQRFLCANYSDAVRVLKDRGVNAIAQLVAKDAERDDCYSLGSNADMTRDLLASEDPNDRPVMIAQTCADMPFMPHDAETDENFWDFVLDHPRYEEKLFAVPPEPVSLTDYAIATHVTSLIRDGGTLQIGIGSLADAIAHVIRLRQVNNRQYRELVEQVIDDSTRALRSAIAIETDTFDAGLYACSEMLVEGFLPLIEAGVLKRRVQPRSDPDGPAGIFLHAGFFLGSARLYRQLRELSDSVRQSIEMTGVSFVNTLDHDMERKAGQRTHARFINSAMMVTLNGAAVSDGLDDGRVVSGVGGQHDFVVMAHALANARSIIALSSTRTRAGRAESNIVYNFGHTTIPRHLCDIIVTEYGAADLRGRTDRDVVAAMLAISDSRFQEKLLSQAKDAGKIEQGYRIPDAFARNTPESIAKRLGSKPVVDVLAHYPLGTDLDDVEARLAIALKYLKEQAGSRRRLAGLALKGAADSEQYSAELERLRLLNARGLEERLNRRILLASLESTADSRPLRH